MGLACKPNLEANPASTLTFEAQHSEPRESAGKQKQKLQTDWRESAQTGPDCFTDSQRLEEISPLSSPRLKYRCDFLASVGPCGPTSNRSGPNLANLPPSSVKLCQVWPSWAQCVRIRARTCPDSTKYVRTWLTSAQIWPDSDKFVALFACVVRICSSTDRLAQASSDALQANTLACRYVSCIRRCRFDSCSIRSCLHVCVAGSSCRAAVCERIALLCRARAVQRHLGRAASGFQQLRASFTHTEVGGGFRASQQHVRARTRGHRRDCVGCSAVVQCLTCVSSCFVLPRATNAMRGAE